MNNFNLKGEKNMFKVGDRVEYTGFAFIYRRMYYGF
jgi:hypothetical protein